MRLISVCVYNPTITQDETAAHENIQAFYPSTWSQDLQLNEVGLCTAIVAMQDRFSCDVSSETIGKSTLAAMAAGGGGLTSSSASAEGVSSEAAASPSSSSTVAAPSAASLAKGFDILNSILRSSFPMDEERLGAALLDAAGVTDAAAKTAAPASASSSPSPSSSTPPPFNGVRRAFTTGTRRWLVVPVEKDFYVTVSIARGPEGTVQPLTKEQRRRHEQEQKARQQQGGGGGGSGHGGSAADLSSLGGDGGDGAPPSTSSPLSAGVPLMHPLEDDADDGVDDAIELYIRCYYKIFKMMFGSMRMNYHKIVRPLTKAMLRQLPSKEAKEAAKAARQEEMGMFRELVEQGLLSKLVPELRDWLLQQRVDGSSFIAPFGMELLSISGPASLCMSSVIGVLHNAHPGALRGVVAMCDGCVFHSSIGAEDTETLYRLVDYYNNHAPTVSFGYRGSHHQRHTVRFGGGAAHPQHHNIMHTNTNYSGNASGSSMTRHSSGAGGGVSSFRGGLNASTASGNTSNSNSAMMMARGGGGGGARSGPTSPTTPHQPGGGGGYGDLAIEGGGDTNDSLTAVTGGGGGGGQSKWSQGNSLRDAKSPSPSIPRGAASSAGLVVGSSKQLATAASSSSNGKNSKSNAANNNSKSARLSELRNMVIISSYGGGGAAGGGGRSGGGGSAPMASSPPSSSSGGANVTEFTLVRSSESRHSTCDDLLAVASESGSSTVDGITGGGGATRQPSASTTTAGAGAAAGAVSPSVGRTTSVDRFDPRRVLATEDTRSSAFRRHRPSVAGGGGGGGGGPLPMPSSSHPSRLVVGGASRGGGNHTSSSQLPPRAYTSSQQRQFGGVGGNQLSSFATSLSSGNGSAQTTANNLSRRGNGTAAAVTGGGGDEWQVVGANGTTASMATTTSATSRGILHYNPAGGGGATDLDFLLPSAYNFSGGSSVAPSPSRQDGGGNSASHPLPSIAAVDGSAAHITNVPTGFLGGMGADAAVAMDLFDDEEGSYIFINDVAVGVLTLEVGPIQLLFLVHEKYLLVPQLQQGLKASIEKVLELINGEQQLTQFVLPSVSSSKGFDQQYLYHYTNAMNLSAKSSMRNVLLADVKERMLALSIATQGFSGSAAILSGGGGGGATGSSAATRGSLVVPSSSGAGGGGGGGSRSSMAAHMSFRGSFLGPSPSTTAASSTSSAVAAGAHGSSSSAANRLVSMATSVGNSMRGSLGYDASSSSVSHRTAVVNDRRTAKDGSAFAAWRQSVKFDAMAERMTGASHGGGGWDGGGGGGASSRGANNGGDGYDDHNAFNGTVGGGGGGGSTGLPKPRRPVPVKMPLLHASHPSLGQMDLLRGFMTPSGGVGGVYRGEYGGGSGGGGGSSVPSPLALLAMMRGGRGLVPHHHHHHHSANNPYTMGGSPARAYPHSRHYPHDAEEFAAAASCSSSRLLASLLPTPAAAGAFGMAVLMQQYLCAAGQPYAFDPEAYYRHLLLSGGGGGISSGGSNPNNGSFRSNPNGGGPPSSYGSSAAAAAAGSRSNGGGGVATKAAIPDGSIDSLHNHPFHNRLQQQQQQKDTALLKPPLPSGDGGASFWATPTLGFLGIGGGSAAASPTFDGSLESILGLNGDGAAANASAPPFFFPSSLDPSSMSTDITCLGTNAATGHRIRSAICRTAQRTWCCYVSSEWREFSLILEADSLEEAEEKLSDVLQMVFVGIFQDVA